MFNIAWEHGFFFIENMEGKAQCLICQHIASRCALYYVERHFKIRHIHYNQLVETERALKLWELKAKFFLIYVAPTIKEIMEDEGSSGEKSDSEDLLEPMDDIIEFNDETSSDDPSYTRETTQIGKGSRKRPSKTDVGSLLLEEKLSLVKARRTFYEQENLRAQEKHMEEMEILSAKRELLYLEIAEKKRKLKVSA